MTTIPVPGSAFPPRSAFVTGVGRGFSILYGIATIGLLVGMATLDSIPGVPLWRLLISTAFVVDIATLIAAIGLLRRRPALRRLPAHHGHSAGWRWRKHRSLAVHPQARLGLARYAAAIVQTRIVAVESLLGPVTRAHERP